ALQPQVERGRGRERVAGEKRATAGGDRSGGGKPRPYIDQATAATLAVVGPSAADVGTALAAAREWPGAAARPLPRIAREREAIGA
ncbi:MAG TPA: hypothetical protein PK435_16355, partial [Thermoanaerobaculaceae bacterium]|nr:hypothetical protein [Thermoanaerobaculaceae bacterium]